MLQKCVTHLQFHALRYYAHTAAAAAVAKSPSVTNKTPIISCKRKEFDLFIPTKEGSKFRSIPLASGSWLHNKSKDDYFTLNASVSLEELQGNMQNIDEFLTKSGANLAPEFVTNLQQELAINQLTPIQTNAMLKIYDSKHVLIAAETGCGKTLAYLLPIVQQIWEHKQNAGLKSDERKMNTPLAVILTPGRELAAQVGNVAEQLCKSTGIQIKTILGGNTKKLIMNPEFADVDIVVATIGALSKLVTTGIYRMQEVRHVVLDEADTLLDESFADKLQYFLRRFTFYNKQTQNDSKVSTQLILASATMPTNIEESLQQVIDVQTVNEVVSPNLHKIMPHVRQKFMRITKASRPAHLLTIVKTELSKKRPIIVFSNKSAACDYVSMFLNNCGVNCLNLNGDMLMKIRIGRFEQFQRGECNVLSTTDVASRGLDTTRARHVINFDFPLHISDYIHRCGRIGRVGSNQNCLVTNLISSRREIDVVQRIEHAARTGGLLPNVNANIKGIITKQIMRDMEMAGLEPLPKREEAF